MRATPEDIGWGNLFDRVIPQQSLCSGKLIKGGTIQGEFWFGEINYKRDYLRRLWFRKVLIKNGF